MISVNDLMKQTNKGPVVRSSVPLGLGAGLPELEIVGDSLLVTYFYYRVEPRPDDRSLVMPPEYALAIDYPSGKLVRFEALRQSGRFVAQDYSAPVGTFRHEAVRHLDRAGYKAKKAELFAALDRLVAYLGGEGERTADDDRELAELYGMLAEPGLLPWYRDIAPEFFARYIEQ